MKQEEYIKLLNQIYDRLATHKKTKKWVTIVDENLDIDEESSSHKSNHCLIVKDIEDIADTINWILELLNTTDTSIGSYDPRGYTRLRLLFSLLLQSFANLKNRYGLDKYQVADALKEQKKLVSNAIAKDRKELEEVADYRDLMIVHAQTPISSLCFSADSTTLELSFGGSNLLNQSEQVEIDKIYAKYSSNMPIADNDQHYMTKYAQLYVIKNSMSNEDLKEYSALIKRAGANSPSLSELTKLLDRLSEAILI